jgi:hypothetical protein
MGFIAPLFLAAVLAVGIPVLVHLTHREKKEPVLFPSLMFLHRVPFRSRQRQAIRHWWLFALRALALVLLALAFARPILSSRLLRGSAPRATVIVLDRSASMGGAGRWQRATAAAREVLDRRQDGARIGLYAAADQVEILGEPTPDIASLRASLLALRPSDGGANVPAAIRLAGERLAQSGGGELVLISDFQRAGFEGAEPAALPAGVSLRPLDVGGEPVRNVGITALSVDPSPDADDRVLVTARLVATGSETPAQVPVRLEIEGRLAAAETVTVQPGSGASVRFPSLRRPERPRAARVVIPADAFAADDVHHFVFAAPQSIGVLLASRGDAAGGDGFYLRQALAVAEAPRLEPLARPVTALRDADLGAARVVVLHDAPFPSGLAGDHLLDWVARGNGLFIALGANGTLPRVLRDSLGNAGAVTERGNGAGLVPSDPQHPLFARWDLAPGEALSGVRAWRYRRLDAPSGVIARFDDGAAALVGARYGQGRVLVWTGDLANRWNDLPVQPVFVPLLVNAVRWLAGWTPQPPAWSVGTTADLSLLVGSAGPFVVERPGGTRQALGDASHLGLSGAGTWTIRRQGSREPLLLVAANTPPSESDPARVNPAGAVQPGAPVAAAEAASGEPEERGRGQRLWWFALAAVLALVAAESAVASRLRGYA